MINVKHFKRKSFDDDDDDDDGEAWCFMATFEVYNMNGTDGEDVVIIII